jgi:hypothetical protein
MILNQMSKMHGGKEKVQPYYVQHTKQNRNATDTYATKPTGSTIDVGDFLMIVITNDYNGTTDQWPQSVAPSGWTSEINSGGLISRSRIGVMWKIADGTEPSQEHFYNATVTVQNTVTHYIHIKGASTTDPFGLIGASEELYQTQEYNSTAVGVTGDAKDLGVAVMAFDYWTGDPFSTGSTGWIWKDTGHDISGDGGNSGGFGFNIYTTAAAQDCVIATSGGWVRRVAQQFRIQS